MGTGGGGPAESGLALLKATLEAGHPIRVIDPADLADEAWVCTGAFVGSIAPASEEMLGLREKLGLGRRVEHEIVEAVRELESYTGLKIGGLAACELGGLNTPAPISAAAALGIPMVDGDYAGGRAIPGSVHLKLSIDGQKIWPRAFCDPSGNVVVIKEAVNNAMMERIQKQLSIAALDMIGGAGHLLDGREVKRLINPGSISRCLEIGRLLRQAREEGLDPAEHLTRALGGWVLFRGRVEEKPWESKLGYMIGHFEMSGLDDYRGQRFKVWFQNENMISWLNGETYVTCPDPISVIDLATGYSTTNDAIQPGDRLAVVGLKAAEYYRQPAGLKVLGPGYFGFDIPYRPIESLVKPAGQGAPGAPGTGGFAWSR